MLNMLKIMKNAILVDLWGFEYGLEGTGHWREKGEKFRVRSSN